MITAKQIIENVTYSDMLQLWNEYNEYANSMDDNIYILDDDNINESYTSAMDALRSAHFGKFSIADKYFQFDGYGNLESLNDSDLDELSWSEVAVWLNENTEIAERYGLDIEE